MLFNSPGEASVSTDRDDTRKGPTSEASVDRPAGVDRPQVGIAAIAALLVVRPERADARHAVLGRFLEPKTVAPRTELSVRSRQRLLESRRP